MTQEDKELLLKDLCTRLPYKVKISIPELFTNKEQVETLNEIFKGNDGLFRVNDSGILIEYIKPYLFPLSNMTEEKILELYKITYDTWYNDSLYYKKEEWINFRDSIKNNNLCFKNCIWLSDINKVIDWFNKNHFDYRGLIENGLAIDATGLNIY